MRAYALSGNRASALDHYDECVRVLAEEVGVGAEPEGETVALDLGIRAGNVG